MKDKTEQNDSGKLELIAHKSFSPYSEMYKVVDFLNKSLKERKIMFGLTQDQNSGNMTITIYEV